MGWIILSVVLLFLVLAAGTMVSSKWKKSSGEAVADTGHESKTVPTDCCGAHEVCEFEEQSVADKSILYFEDEELDRFRNTPPENYSDSHIDEFREVLYTLQPKEIRYWLMSMEKRQIAVPGILQDEARLLMAGK